MKTVNSQPPAPELFDPRVCQLGEGPLWHPEGKTLFWVDVLERRLLGRTETQTQSWDFDEFVTAIGRVDDGTLALATESGLKVFTISTGQSSVLCDIESEVSTSRSNDGRADPWGGFWVGTMSKTGDSGAGAIYRWYRGEVRKLVSDLSVPNGICFDQSRSIAYFADSAARQIHRVAVNPQTGWPVAEPQLFFEQSFLDCTMDGAVVDAEGCLWSAQWDGHCLFRISPGGKVLLELPALTQRPTCPAFGGEHHNDLLVTTAAVGVVTEVDPSNEDARNPASVAGVTQIYRGLVKGVPEPRVILA